MAGTLAVPFDSVRVWRGFKAKDLPRVNFCKKLGEVFIPVTVHLQVPLGLTAYLPAVLPEEKPEFLPDEVALVFYSSQEEYKKTFASTAGRAYGLLHSSVFDFQPQKSHSDFPKLWENEVVCHRPYSLFTKDANWYDGRSCIYIGIRNTAISAAEFVSRFAEILNHARTKGGHDIDGAYFVITEDYLLYWEHWPDDGSEAAGGLSRLFGDISVPVLVQEAKKIDISAKIHDEYPGLSINGGECLNIQFKRTAAPVRQREEVVRNARIPVYGLYGNSHTAPADTLVGYWSALSAGAAGFVAGLQLAADGTVVCRPDGQYNARQFRSTPLDDSHRPTGDSGLDLPWEKAWPEHPSLDAVLRLFGRRTKIMLSLPDKPSGQEERLIAEKTQASLVAFGLAERVVVMGEKRMCDFFRERLPGAVTALRVGHEASVEDAVADAGQCGADYLVVSAGQITDATARQLAGAQLEILLISQEYAISPAEFRRAAKIARIGGLIVRSVDRGVGLVEPPALVLADDFAGREINQAIWSCGYSHANGDTLISQDDGLIIAIAAGGDYSGGAAVSHIPIYGRFDARVDFQVDSPQQATTFELAAIGIDPGYFCIENTRLSSKNVNLTFDVHGAPPYASSERDEDDGFRIGWNNGFNLTKIDSDWSASSVNMYNKYSRDVGSGHIRNNTGTLRLVRNGAVFCAYYKDTGNKEWVCSGAALVPSLGEDVFIRLAAKHWKKGGTPPANRVVFRNFRLFQF